jgi:hypothetical protein
MNKIALSVATLLAVAGMAAPALANISDIDKLSVMNNLNEQGVHAIDVNDNGDGTVRVTVLQADGTQTFVTYNLNTQKLITSAADRNG